jgi:hypothetical protein
VVGLKLNNLIKILSVVLVIFQTGVNFIDGIVSPQNNDISCHSVLDRTLTGEG